MLATAIILFREVLEAALIVTIVLAATRGVARSRLMVAAGMIVGVACSLVVAGFADVIASAASGMGQEIFNATILFFAAAMLGWHNIWMSTHGRKMAQSMSAVGRAVTGGSRPLYALAVVVGVAVLREGSEVVLFLYGITASGHDQAGRMFAGGAAGFAAAAMLGAAMYGGLLRISQKRLFVVTNWMVLLLAAGMASQGAALLVQADVLPAFGDTLWDTSGILPETNLLGQALQTLVGYTSRPYGVQLMVYVATLVTVVVLGQLAARSRPTATV